MIIADPEETEKLLLDAGFEVSPVEMGFKVSLKNRKVQRSEVADVLACETTDLTITSNGILVR